MDDGDVRNAMWWAGGAAAFLAWQGAAWIAARGRWQRARERGAASPPPRFMGATAGTVATFLLDLRPVIAAGWPVVVACAWTFFAVVGLGLPLAFGHGVAGVIGAAFVWGTGSAFGVAVLRHMGERGREEAQRTRARIAAEVAAGDAAR